MVKEANPYAKMVARTQRVAKHAYEAGRRYAPYIANVGKPFVAEAVREGIRTAFKYVSRGSQTETQHNLKSKDGVVALHNQMTTTGFTRMLNPPKKHFLMHPGTIIYSQYCTQLLSWDVGRQGVQDMFEMFNLNQLLTTPAGTADPLVEFDKAVFEFDPNRNTTGNAFIAEQAPEMRFCHIKTSKMTCEFTNLTSNLVVGEVLWCLAKKNSTRTPGEEWQYQLKNEALGQGNAVQENLVTPASAQGGVPLYYFPGKSPTTLCEWNRRWKIIKKESFQLQAGASLKMYAKVYYNRTLNRQTFESYDENVDGTGNASSPPSMLAGLTLVPLLICRSTATFDTTAGVDRMTYGSGKVGWVCTQQLSIVPYGVVQNAPYERIFPSIHNAGTYDQKNIGQDDTVVSTAMVT